MFDFSIPISHRSSWWPALPVATACAAAFSIDLSSPGRAGGKVVRRAFARRAGSSLLPLRGFASSREPVSDRGHFHRPRAIFFLTRRREGREEKPHVFKFIASTTGRRLVPGPHLALTIGNGSEHPCSDSGRHARTGTGLAPDATADLANDEAVEGFHPTAAGEAAQSSRYARTAEGADSLITWAEPAPAPS